MCLHAFSRSRAFRLRLYVPSETVSREKQKKKEETIKFSLFSLSPPKQTNKRRIQKWYTIYKDHITLDDYEVKDGSNLELYYN
jgi:phage terminase small subunit